MIRSRFSPGAFLAAFCCTYAVAFEQDFPLFRYYPLHGDFNWGAAVLKDAGPAITWYGLMANAALVAVFAAVLVPERAAHRLLGGYLWLFPCAAMLECIFLLRHLFA